MVDDTGVGRFAPPAFSARFSSAAAVAAVAAPVLVLVSESWGGIVAEAKVR